MAERGPAAPASIRVASPKGGWTAVGALAVLTLATLGLAAATAAGPFVAGRLFPAPADMARAPGSGPAPAGVAVAGVRLGAGPASSTSSSPVAIASSWSMAPVEVPPAAAAPIAPAAAELARQVASDYGVTIALNGQDWGADAAAQTRNIGAVMSAIAMLPRTVASSITANPNVSLSVLSNQQGRTVGGWQPYGNAALNFYSTSDQSARGVHAASQVILATGAGRTSAAHELLHAYQFRASAPGDYVSALLGDEMRSFMATTGWRQASTGEQVLAAAHEPWPVINSLYVYEGRPLTYTGENGASVQLSAANPLEAFAAAGALYYARPDGTPLPDWPEYWAWFAAHLG